MKAACEKRPHPLHAPLPLALARARAQALNKIIRATAPPSRQVLSVFGLR